jgi:hypothetical protein
MARGLCWLGDLRDCPVEQLGFFVLRSCKLGAVEQWLFSGHKRECFGGKPDVFLSAGRINVSSSEKTVVFDLCRSQTNMCREVKLMRPLVKTQDLPCRRVCPRADLVYRQKMLSKQLDVSGLATHPLCMLRVAGPTWERAQSYPLCDSWVSCIGVLTQSLAAMNAVKFFVEQYPSLWCLGMKVAHEVYWILRWNKAQDWMPVDAWTEGHAGVFSHGL